MAEIAHTEADQRALRNAKVLMGAAVISVLVAVAAGLILLIAEPEAGSTTEAALGLTAAIGGLATAAFAIAAAIYAQVKNLWRFAPVGLRVAAWAFIAIGIAITLWNLVDQLF